MSNCNQCLLITASLIEGEPANNTFTEEQPYCTITEIYMMIVLNINPARDKCPSPITDSHKTDFKVGDMVLLKNHTTTTALDGKYKTSY